MSKKNEKSIDDRELNLEVLNAMNLMTYLWIRHEENLSREELAKLKKLHFH